MLHGTEVLDKVIGIDIGCGASYLAHGLSEGAAAEFECFATEVDVVQRRARCAFEHRRYGSFHIGNFAGSRYDDSAGGFDALSVGVFLSHGEAVLTGGDVYAQAAHEVAASLDCTVEGSIFAGVLARPHPVGAQRYSGEPTVEVCADDIG